MQFQARTPEEIAKTKALARARYLRVRGTPEFKAHATAMEKARYRALRGDPKHRARLIVDGARQRAKARGLDFDLTSSDVVIPETCPVLGIPIILAMHIGSGTASANSPSLDRFDNSKGYVRGNVRVISNRANLLKRDATLEEMRRIVAYMAGEMN